MFSILFSSFFFNFFSAFFNLHSLSLMLFTFLPHLRSLFPSPPAVSLPFAFYILLTHILSFLLILF
jgi:hypothetical protein